MVLPTRSMSTSIPIGQGLATSPSSLCRRKWTCCGVTVSAVAPCGLNDPNFATAAAKALCPASQFVVPNEKRPPHDRINEGEMGTTSSQSRNCALDDHLRIMSLDSLHIARSLISAERRVYTQGRKFLCVCLFY
jgi:hypothetical protein